MSTSPKQASLQQAISIVRSTKTGVLAVIDHETQGPYSSLVNYCLDDSARPIILLSGMARHTKALMHNARSSLLVADELPTQGDPLVACRVTMMGHAVQVDKNSVVERYLQSHPYAAMYVDFADFGFWSLQIEQIYVVAGFGRIFSYSAEEYAAYAD